MLRIGQPLRGAGATDPVPGWAGVATTTLRDMGITAGQMVARCLDHHLLLLVTAGHGTHQVDFEPVPCRPGTLLWAGPGQVVHYGGQPGVDAVLVGFADDVVDLRGVGAPALDPPLRPVHWQLAGEDEDAIINEVSQLVVDCQRHRSGALAAELLRHQLAVLLLRIALLPTRPGGRASAGELRTFGRFRELLEESFNRTRRVEEYAARMGCSVRTLTRACLSATGRSAKQIVDDRVALAAKRLLACTDLPVAEVGRRLGFPEPTNFGRFFQREVGRSPGAFRAELQQPSVPRLPAQRRPPLA